MSIRKLSTASVKTSTRSSKFWDQSTILNSYASIATATVGAGGTSTITFSSIPLTYTNLQIRYIARATNAATFANIVSAKFNEDKPNPNYYERHRLNGRGDNLVYSDSRVGSSSNFGFVAGGGTISNNFTSGIVDILDYTSTNKNKTIRIFSGIAGQSVDTNNDIALFSSLYFPSPSAAITRIDLTIQDTNFAQHSQFALYGIKG